MAAGIGEAIGLQDKPNLFAAQAAGALARMSAEESRREAARRKAQEKDEADTKKVISDADIYSKNTTWHKMYAPAVQREMADFANDYINYKVQNPNAPGNGAYAVTKLQELQGRMNRLKQNNDAFKDFEKGVHEGKYYADPDLFKKIYETDFSKKLYRDDNGRVVSGDWGGLKPNDLYGAMIDANGDFISNPVKKFDFQKTINGRMNNSNYWTSTGITTKPRKGVPNAYDEVQDFQEDPAQRESFVDEMTSNPDAVRAWQIENKDRLSEARKNNPSLNNDRNYSDFVQEQMAGDIRLKASGRKQTSKISHFAAPKAPAKPKESKTLSLDSTLDDLSKFMTETEEEIMADPKRVALQDNVDRLAGEVEEAEKSSSFDKGKLAGMKQSLEEQQAKLGQMGDVKAETKYTFPVTLKTEGASTVVNNNDDVIDLATGKKLSGVNQFKFIPRLIKLRMVKGEWKPYVYGESTDKISATDNKGNVISDKTASATIAVPLNKVEGFLNKNNTPTSWTKEAIQRANSSIKRKGSEPATAQPSPQQTPKSAPTAQSNVNSGNNAPDQYISSILDFENSKGYKNFGFTSHNGTLNKSQATEKFKKEYLPMVAELPLPLQAVAGDFAFNSEDPRASLMVTSGWLSPEEKKALYTKGKLDKEKVEQEWNEGGKNNVIAFYDEDNKAFLDEFDKERLRSYKGTNGADKKFSEWAERVKVSRKVADKLLGGSNEKRYTREELKAMSPQYTDEIIDAAVAAGKIKLK